MALALAFVTIKSLSAQDCIPAAHFDARMSVDVEHLEVPDALVPAAIAFWDVAAPQPLRPELGVNGVRTHKLTDALMLVSYERDGCVVAYLRTNTRIFGSWLRAWDKQNTDV